MNFTNNEMKDGNKTATNSSQENYPDSLESLLKTHKSRGKTLFLLFLCNFFLLYVILFVVAPQDIPRFAIHLLSQLTDVFSGPAAERIASSDPHFLAIVFCLSNFATMIIFRALGICNDGFSIGFPKLNEISKKPVGIGWFSLSLAQIIAACTVGHVLGAGVVIVELGILG